MPINLAATGAKVILGGNEFDIWAPVHRTPGWSATWTSRGFDPTLKLTGYDFVYLAGSGKYYFPVAHPNGVVEIPALELTRTGLATRLSDGFFSPQRSEITWSDVSPATIRYVPGSKATPIIGRPPAAVPAVPTSTGVLPLLRPPPIRAFVVGDKVEITDRTNTVCYGVAPNKTTKTATLPQVATITRFGLSYAYFCFDGLPGEYYIEKDLIRLSTGVIVSGTKKVAGKPMNPDGCECGGYAAGFKKGQEGHAQWCPARSQRLVDIDMKRAIAAAKVGA